MEGQGDRRRAFLQTLEEKELTMQLLGQYRHCLNSSFLDVFNTEQTCVSQENLQSSFNKVIKHVDIRFPIFQYKGLRFVNCNLN